MRKSLTIILALVALAGTAGVVIGIAAAHARRSTAKADTLASADGAAAKSPVNDPPPAGREPDIIRFVRDPQPAPPFLANDLNGNVVSTAGLQGKVVIVNFWATWCPPCRAEIPDLIRLASKYKDRLEIIGISMDDDASPQEVKTFAEHFGIKYPIVMARYNTKIPANYGAGDALPTSFIVDTQGRVVQKHMGLYPPEIYETEVRSLLGLPVSSKVETFEDKGQVFLKNVELASDLPGVDFDGLTPEQKKIVLKRLNSESCTCGCKLTIAQCRVSDETCMTSKQLAAKIVKEVLAGETTPSTTTKTN